MADSNPSCPGAGVNILQIPMFKKKSGILNRKELKFTTKLITKFFKLMLKSPNNFLHFLQFFPPDLKVPHHLRLLGDDLLQLPDPVVLLLERILNVHLITIEHRLSSDEVLLGRFWWRSVVRLRLR